MTAQAKDETRMLAERMAGVSFNPGARTDVHECKTEFATCIERMLRLRDNSFDGEQKRLASIAITELQGAQMFAVKALTWNA